MVRAGGTSRDLGHGGGGQVCMKKDWKGGGKKKSVQVRGTGDTDEQTRETDALTRETDRQSRTRNETGRTGQVGGRTYARGVWCVHIWTRRG